MKAGIYSRKTLPDLLITAAQDFPYKGIGYVLTDGSIKFTTYPELLSQAKEMIPGIKVLNLSPGDKVMIVMTQNEEIIPVLWACFLSGIIPTILQPPVSFTEFNQSAQKIENVYKSLGRPKVILSSDLIKGFQSDVIPSQSIIIKEDLKNNFGEQQIYHPLDTDIAFIQFSSGSTGDPKGVVLTHRNILTNLAAICVGLDIYDVDVFANWMPLYHDMGLFGYHLCPLFGDCDQYHIETIDFVKKPSIWLDVMDKVGCTITGCPNFGQALLLRYLKNREENHWDLSSLKAIVNGAEPISPKIMTEFISVLSRYQLKKESMLPAYGMAEATLAITFSDLLKQPLITPFNRWILQREGRAVPEKENNSQMTELVSVGKPLSDIGIRIVDETGHLVEEREEGHIMITGKSVTNRYYNNPLETNHAIDKEGWLKTGDKGFIFNGNLYITGRIKDIIFIHGQNYYAHDLENLVYKYKNISYGKIVIGGTFDPKKGQDQIILFLVGSSNQATYEAYLDLRNFLRDTYGITIDKFIPIRSNQIPRTSSGKIQRYKLISRYQNGEFDEAIAAFEAFSAKREA